MNYKEKLKKRKRILKKLWAEQKYFELQCLLGNLDYRDLKKIQNKDIENEIGKKLKWNSYLLLEHVKRKITIGMYMSLVAFTLDKYIDIYLNCAINNVNIEKTLNEEELENLNKLDKQYQIDIENYANSIKALNLSDLEIYVKEMQDMWQNIYGYKVSSSVYDERTLFQYALYEDNYGVCRNFADDCVARLNKINPEYHAQAVEVILNEVCINNTKRYILETSEEKSENFFNEWLKKKTGNHLAVMVDVPNQDYSLILDPTNPSIGLIENGQIYMLGENGNFYKQNMEFSTLAYYKNLDDFLNFYRVLLKSYINNTTPSTISKEYGIEKQNMALDKVEGLDTNYRTYSEEILNNPIEDKNGNYMTWTARNSLIIMAVKNSTSPSSLKELYHIINLRLKNDVSVRNVLIYSSNNDIDIDKINFPEELIFVEEKNLQPSLKLKK